MAATSSESPSAEARFEFGENWRRFLEVVGDERIAEAARSLEAMLGPGALRDRTVLDAGCGSGLFSLAALRLGAARVHSFDFDPSSVATAQELQRRFAPEAVERWQIERGDVLDETYMASLGSFDVVYSWGVLHHTGDLWRATANAAAAVAPGGRLFIAIYNDQGWRSRLWTEVKRTYHRLPEGARTPYAVAVMTPREALSAAKLVAKSGPAEYVRAWTGYRRSRGMSRWHDLLDWVGGYPFEVAKPEEVFDFLRDSGFALERLKTCGGGLGCNEFLLRRDR